MKNTYEKIEVDFATNIIFLELLKKNHHFSKNELFFLNDIIKTFKDLKESVKKLNY